ncbi:MAG: DUF5681 domain-containing protein [Pseudolabrys sp.]
MPFKKGQSGNPGGRPKILADIREVARAHTASAMNALVQIVENNNAPPAARVAAANSLLDRGYGKPEAKIDANISRHAVIRAPEPCASVEEWQAKYAPEFAKA